jgi:hypothetical protein
MILLLFEIVKRKSVIYGKIHKSVTNRFLPGGANAAREFKRPAGARSPARANIRSPNIVTKP